MYLSSTMGYLLTEEGKEEEEEEEEEPRGDFDLFVYYVGKSPENILLIVSLLTYRLYASHKSLVDILNKDCPTIILSFGR